MQKPQDESKPLMAARFRDEAITTLAKRTDKRSRFLDLALSNGCEVEPVGRLCGKSTLPNYADSQGTAEQQRAHPSDPTA
jgi:hypothetical protein